MPASLARPCSGRSTRVVGGHDNTEFRARRCGAPPPAAGQQARRPPGRSEGGRGLDDPVLRQRLARVYADIACMRFLTERSLADPSAAGAGGSLAKLTWAHCDQELAALAVDLIGPPQSRTAGARTCSRSARPPSPAGRRDQPLHRGRARPRVAPLTRGGPHWGPTRAQFDVTMAAPCIRSTG